MRSPLLAHHLSAQVHLPAGPALFSGHLRIPLLLPLGPPSMQSHGPGALAAMFLLVKAPPLVVTASRHSRCPRPRF